MKVKAELHRISSQFFTPSNPHTCMSHPNACVSFFNFLPTYSLGSRSQISGLIFKVLNTQILSPNLKEVTEILALLKTTPSKL